MVAVVVRVEEDAEVITIRALLIKMLDCRALLRRADAMTCTAMMDSLGNEPRMVDKGPPPPPPICL